MFNRTKRFLFYIIVLIFLTSCTDEYDQKKNIIKQSNSNTKKELKDTPISKDNCIGWKQSLANGRHDKLVSVEDCLRALAVSNRTEARHQAKVLQDWNIQTRYEATLPVLINTLARFKSDTDLKQYLTKLNVLNGKGAFEDDTRIPSLTPDSFLVRYGRVHWFDVETGTFPNNHDYLLSEIARLSPLFKGVTFKEIAPINFESDKQPYELFATFDSREFRQTAENHGDWYDLEAVLVLLNRISEEINSPDRFVTLPTGDQTAIVMVIEQAALQTLRDDGLLILTESDQAMLAGKAFENKVKKAKEPKKSTGRQPN